MKKIGRVTIVIEGVVDYGGDLRGVRSFLAQSLFGGTHIGEDFYASWTPKEVLKNVVLVPVKPKRKAKKVRK